jgi:tetratricopeptide (TPR) repeat protein
LLAEAMECHRAGDLARAETLYARVLALVRNHPIAALNHALLLAATGRCRPAATKLQALLKARPDHASAHFALSRVIAQTEPHSPGRLFHLQRAVALEPGLFDAQLELIETLGMLGRWGDAQLAAEAAMTRLPDRPELPTQLAVALVRAGQRDAAKALLDGTVARHPGYAPALYNLARLLDDRGDMAGALSLYRRARVADPGFEPAAFNLGDLELRSGAVGAAVACFDASLAAQPDDAAALSARLMAAQYVPGVGAASLAGLHAQWEQRVGAALSPSRSVATGPDPERRLHVGLVSADLHEHPVGYFLIRAIEAHDPAQVEYVAYAGSDSSDAVARRFRAAIPAWRSIAAWSDAMLAKEVRRDRIDVLIDLAGHTRDSRLTAFARRPAPIQLSWAGYVGTTGLVAMDGLIADRFHVPAGEEGLYAERIVRLPDGYVCFDPPAEAPPVGLLPAGVDRPLTFAAFHKPTKVNRDVVRLWARVLAVEPGARLMLTYAGFDLPEVRERLSGWFAAEGIAAERLDFRGRVTRANLLGSYNETDIALDTFPYSGGLTTLEALWMGNPVVTLPGQTFAGRHSLSHLSVVGLTETIARDEDEYVAVVRRLAADRDRLAVLRSGLRERVAASPVCDGPRFARNLEVALRDLWRTWCAGRTVC